MVEFAIALPVLVVLMSSVVEFGLAYRNVGFMETSVLVAGRNVAQQAKGRLADYSALQSLSSGLSAMRNGTTKRAIIWKVASSATAPIPPASCLAIGVGGNNQSVKGIAGLCNVYHKAQIGVSALTGFPSGASGSTTCPATAWDSNWCPLGRVNADGVQDYAGVWVEIKSNSMTKLIANGGVTMSRGVVYRLEPPYVGG